MDVDTSEQNRPDATHDITPQLQRFLRNLAQVRQGSPLPWYNFAHPGDALAYPLIPQLYDMVDRERRFLSIQDIIIAPIGLSDRIISLFRRGMVALIDFRTAHLSYFQSQQVAAAIAQAIAESAHVSVAADTITHKSPQ